MVTSHQSSKLQLLVLKALYITKYQPVLCKQKEFYNILLFNLTDYIATKLDLIQEKTKDFTNTFGSTLHPLWGFLFFLFFLSHQPPRSIPCYCLLLSQRSLTRHYSPPILFLELMKYSLLEAILKFCMYHWIFKYINEHFRLL